MRLFRITQTIKRTNASEGYHLDGEWVAPAPAEDVIIKCNIQPYEKAEEKRMMLPAGFTSVGSYVIFTKTKLITVDQTSVSLADRTDIDGVEYVAANVNNWSHLNMRSSHYQVTFVRRDTSAEGTL